MGRPLDVGVPLGAGNAPGHLVIQNGFPKHGGGRFQLGNFYVLALTGPVPMPESAGYGQRGMDGRHSIAPRGLQLPDQWLILLVTHRAHETG